jgi:hypothetical protein
LFRIPLVLLAKLIGHIYLHISVRPIKAYSFWSVQMENVNVSQTT